MEDLLPAAAVRQGFLRGRHGIGIYKTIQKNGDISYEISMPDRLPF